MNCQKIANNLVRKALQTGPAEGAIAPIWNRLHDFSYDLEKAWDEYDMAASYQGGPGERDAQNMMRMLMQLKKAIDALADKEFSNVVRAERRFIKKHGMPDDYADQQSAEIFPA